MCGVFDIFRRLLGLFSITLSCKKITLQAIGMVDLRGASSLGD